MKISINLLPPEVTAQEAKNKKFYKIQAAGIAVILFLIFLTSLTLALRILQSRNIALYQAKVIQAEEEILSLKDAQASVFLLQNRLSIIQDYLGIPSKQSSMYKLISNLMPSSVVINAITIDKSGETTFLTFIPDAASLDSLINNLTLKEKNEGSISRVSVESLNRGRDGSYRISLKIKPNL